MSTPTLAPPGIADTAPDFEEHPAAPASEEDSAPPASEEDSAASAPEADPDSDSETDPESLTASGHTRPGYLRMQVARVLADTPGAEMSVGDVARILGNSGGAIGNALNKLVELEQAVQVGKAPRRWQANAETEKAAGTATIARGTGPATPAPGGTTAPPLPKAAKAAPSRPEPITRPNGQQYHPRALGKHTDVTALRALREAGVPALLYGPPGTGKTSVIEAAFDDLITIAGDGDTTVGDFIGEYTQAEDGTYQFVYGPLVIAMQEGRPLLIDDATLISPKVLAAAYPAMDGRKQIIVKAHKGETITAAPGFYVIAGHNPGVAGAVLTEALSSRFGVQIQVGSDYDLALFLKVEPKAVQIAKNLAERQTKGLAGWAPQLRELKAFQEVYTLLGADIAYANLLGVAPEEDRALVADVIARVLGRKVTALALGKQL
ncbi:ATPase associated with various cellular activities AAA_5 [Catenulispora acidiphila DSM 44928]|uniref:ATPase associated with various cellular activities AAA_5 n=1 Tax=Catenulispora acidiphila (strain DSM 44928 / JCM 14897 / NBRC 102108 / NRRL B-24433 / ID139908) TaxID=479433 RepID=C7QG95_CATAD|nr:AAA family ATPase [Catenulispora acidiphila]ACU72940.1 ATPase associated with various cellular activities AAA_5 [Catenulispora acidiphila DSM 44928]